jgi:predicted RNA-binding Zn-ribbon protein involved in translation (DUF1610 family)
MVIQGGPDLPDTAVTTITPGWSKHGMTTIRTTCSLCGDVELIPGELSLELTAANGTGTYWFSCPECGDRQQRPANHRVVAILLATGVAYEVRDDRGPITESEITQFSTLLDSPDWAEQLG